MKKEETNSNVRIRELRKSLKMSQEVFGQNIDVSRDAVSNYEQLRANVPPPTELAIAAKFGVNIEWLRTGNGEMFETTIENYIDKLAVQYNMDDFLKRIIMAYIELDENQREIIKSFIAKITPPPPPEKIFRAARSTDEHTAETAEIPADELQRLRDAPKQTPENNDL